jgi:hypothetical protein
MLPLHGVAMENARFLTGLDEIGAQGVCSTLRPRRSLTGTGKVEAGEFAITVTRRLVVDPSRFLCGPETSEPVASTANSTICPPFARHPMEGHALEPGSIVLAEASIGRIQCFGRSPEIVEAIILAIPVPVIDVAGRPLAMHVEPSEAACPILSAVNPDHAISVIADRAGAAAVGWAWPRHSIPREDTRDAVVRQELDQPIMRQCSRHHGSPASDHSGRPSAAMPPTIATQAVAFPASLRVRETGGAGAIPAPGSWRPQRR